jgi:hypothetical protein
MFPLPAFYRSSFHIFELSFFFNPGLFLYQGFPGLSDKIFSIYNNGYPSCSGKKTTHVWQQSIILPLSSTFITNRQSKREGNDTRETMIAKTPEGVS